MCGDASGQCLPELRRRVHTTADPAGNRVAPGPVGREAPAVGGARRQVNEDPDCRGAVIERVHPAAAVEDVHAGATGDEVVAGAALERVVAAQAGQRVVALAAAQRVGEFVALEHVLEPGAGDVLDAGVAVAVGIAEGPRPSPRSAWIPCLDAE